MRVEDNGITPNIIYEGCWLDSQSHWDFGRLELDSSSLSYTTSPSFHLVHIISISVWCVKVECRSKITSTYLDKVYLCFELALLRWAYRTAPFTVYLVGSTIKARPKQDDESHQEHQGARQGFECVRPLPQWCCFNDACLSSRELQLFPEESEARESNACLILGCLWRFWRLW